MSDGGGGGGWSLVCITILYLFSTLFFSFPFLNIYFLPCTRWGSEIIHQRCEGFSGGKNWVSFYSSSCLVSTDTQLGYFMLSFVIFFLPHDLGTEKSEGG